MSKMNRFYMEQIRRLSPPDAEGMICPECGSYMENEDLFDWSCPECGHFFSEEQWMDEYNQDD